MNIEKPASRDSFLTLLDMALKQKSYRFARQASEKWLTVFPGDLGVNLRLGKILFAEGNRKDSLSILEKLCQTDPEFLGAQEAMAFAYNDGVSEEYTNAMGCVYALGGQVSTGVVLPRWSQILREVRQALGEDQIEAAGKLLNQVLGNGAVLQLVDIMHLQYACATQDMADVMQLANLYYIRWPDCLQSKLWLAQTRLRLGDEVGAVNLMHQCVIGDASGQVVTRLWGSNHRYQQLWPDNLEVKLDMPIPARVAAALGMNQLSAGKRFVQEDNAATMQVNDLSEPEPAQEADGKGLHLEVSDSDSGDGLLLEEIGFDLEVPGADSEAVGMGEIAAEAELVESEESSETPKPHSLEESFERLADMVGLANDPQSDSRFPMYVILSTRSGLREKYGPQTTDVLVEEMYRLQNAVRQHHGWGACVFFPDDMENCKSFGVDPVSASDPWKIKLAIADLDQALAEKGAMVGALMIVGGPEVVPYHHLPNPTDDLDLDVPSDNPYATLDSNYFIPEYPIGRLPGEREPDAGLLLEQLRNVVKYHNGRIEDKPWWAGLAFPFDVLIDMLSRIFRPKVPKQVFSSSGYTAAIWQRSSIAVYRPIGQAGSLLVSPPSEAGGFNPQRFVNSSLGYFNLHGIEDGANWYGQRDFADLSDGPDYPIALRPTDLYKNGQAPDTIFSEACYGGHIYDKNIDEAIALKFISIGARAVIGSTCISYGSVMSPLIGADFLGHVFWKRLREGDPAGVALMRAKVEMARELNKRQGYLDGEDQKTLLSFVLFGDPLAGLPVANQQVKGVQRSLEERQVKTICDNDLAPGNVQKLSGTKLNEVKQILKDYLPGLDNAEVKTAKQYAINGEENSNGESSRAQGKSAMRDTGTVVVTVSKQYKVAKEIHHHYARVTLDPQGKMVKLAISR